MFPFRFGFVALLVLCSVKCLAQSGCYVGSQAAGARMYIIKHPTLGGNNYTSSQPNNNYIVLGSGTYNCTNYPTSTFATNIGAAGAACAVYSESPQILIGNGTIRTYRVYQCPIDDYLIGFIICTGGIAMGVIRRYKLGSFY